MAKKKKELGTDLSKVGAGSTETGVSVESAGTTGERAHDSPARRQALFLKGVAGNCGCPRCCNMRDLADVVLRGPGSEY